MSTHQPSRSGIAAALVACLATVLLAGCASNGGGQGSRLALGQPLKPTSKFEKARQVPITADTHFAAGQLSESQDHLDRAVEQYKKALQKDPKHRQAVFRLGVVNTKRNQFDFAVATWQK